MNSTEFHLSIRKLYWISCIFFTLLHGDKWITFCANCVAQYNKKRSLIHCRNETLTNAKTKAALLPRDQFKLYFFICSLLHQTKVLRLRSCMKLFGLRSILFIRCYYCDRVERWWAGSANFENSNHLMVKEKIVENVISKKTELKWFSTIAFNQLHMKLLNRPRWHQKSSFSLKSANRSTLIECDSV